MSIMVKHIVYQKGKKRTIWVDYLRASITVLVVAHHSALAYTTWASFDKVAYIRSTHAVVDTNRSGILDDIVRINDAFFMPLMFLIGGLFVTDSIRRKGVAAFIKDRIFRLLVPFLVLGTLLMLLAYVPSYILAKETFSLRGYLLDFFITEQWPVGPPWFLWVLFIFNLIAAKVSGWLINTNIRDLFSPLNQPVVFVVLFLGVTLLLYVPLSLVLGDSYWVGFYPFDLQLNRIFLYSGYFGIGLILGEIQFNETIFNASGPLVQQRKVWLWCSGLLCLFIFGFADNMLFSRLQTLIFNSVLCVILSISFLVSYKSAIRGTNLWMQSISESAYLIYLIHFVFVVWIQFFLLRFQLPAILKAGLTFVVSFMISWLMATGLRKVSIVRKFL